MALIYKAASKQVESQKQSVDKVFLIPVAQPLT